MNLGTSAPSERCLSKRWRSYAVLIVLLSAIVAAAIFGQARADRLIGTDERAEQVIQELRPGYRRWFVPWFVPSRSTERVLFGLQASLGVALITYAIVSYRRFNARRQRHASSD